MKKEDPASSQMYYTKAQIAQHSNDLCVSEQKMSVPSLRYLACKKSSEILTFNGVLELLTDLKFPAELVLHFLKILGDKSYEAIKHFDDEKGYVVGSEEKHLCTYKCREEFEKISAPIERLKTTGKLSKEQYFFYLFSADRYFHIEKGQPLLSPIRVGPLRQLMRHALDLEEEPSQNGFEVSDLWRAYFLSTYYTKNLRIHESFS